MSEVKAHLSLNLVRRIIRRDVNGKIISDTVTNYVTGKTYPTPKRKKVIKSEKVVFT